MSKPEVQIYYVAERGFPDGKETRWIGEWSHESLSNVEDFLTKFHIRPDEQVRIVMVTKTENREVIQVGQNT